VERSDPRFSGPRPDFAQQQVGYHTEKLNSLRVVTTALVEGEQAKKVLSMATSPVLIKGLSEAVAAAKQSIAVARAAPAALQESIAAMVATCTDLKTQVDAMHDDLKFEATQLGNGGATSETKSGG
jgi:hypothetical protein